MEITEKDKANESLQEKIIRQQKLEREQLQVMMEVYSHYRDGTFLSIDIVGSTKLKEGVDSVVVVSSFRAFHQFIKEHITQSISHVFSGDGIMCLFKLPQEAVDSALRIYKNLETLNKKFSGLKHYINVRMGINSGPLLMEDGQELGTLTERNIDIAGHLQKYCEPGRLFISEHTWESLANKIDFKKMWKTIDSTIVYRSKQNFTPLKERARYTPLVKKLLEYGDTIRNRVFRHDRHLNIRILAFALIGAVVLGGVFYVEQSNKINSPGQLKAASHPVIVNDKIKNMKENQHLGEVWIKKKNVWKQLPSTIYLIIPEGNKAGKRRITGVKTNSIIELKKAGDNRFYRKKWGLLKLNVDAANGCYVFTELSKAQRFIKSINKE